MAEETVRRIKAAQIVEMVMDPRGRADIKEISETGYDTLFEIDGIHYSWSNAAVRDAQTILRQFQQHEHVQFLQDCLPTKSASGGGRKSKNKPNSTAMKKLNSNGALSLSVRTYFQEGNQGTLKDGEEVTVMYRQEDNGARSILVMPNYNK